MGGVVVDIGDSGVKVLDGGWGWVVFFGCFIMIGFFYVFLKVVSVFFKEFIWEFGVGYSDMVWIFFIFFVMFYGMGFLCSILVNWFGCCFVMMVGGFFVLLGMVLVLFVINIIYMYFCIGVIMGLGFVLNF